MEDGSAVSKLVRLGLWVPRRCYLVLWALSLLDSGAAAASQGIRKERHHLLMQQQGKDVCKCFPGLGPTWEGTL